MELTELLEKSKTFEVDKALIVEIDEKRKYFLEKFPLSSIKNITIEDFVYKKDGNSFCKLLDSNQLLFDVEEGKNVTKFGFFVKDEKYYSWESGKNKELKSEEEIELYFNKFKEALIDFIELVSKGDFNGISKLEVPIFKNVLLKILCLYFPDKFLYVTDNHVLLAILNCFDVNKTSSKLGTNIIENSFVANKLINSNNDLKDWNKIKLGEFLKVNFAKTESNYWVFQGNLNFFDVAKAIKDNVLDTWSVKAHKDKIKNGDKFILWITGNGQGCYGLGEIISDVYEGEDDENQIQYYIQDKSNTVGTRVRIKLTHDFSEKPISKTEIDQIIQLKALKVGSQGTNFAASKEEFNYLLKLRENSFNVLLSKFEKDKLDVYFTLLKSIISKYDIQKGDERVVFSVVDNQLNFTIGQRYCLNLRKVNSITQFRVISTSAISDNTVNFEGNPIAVLNDLDNLNLSQIQLDKVYQAIENELNKTKKSGFLKNNNTDFEKYVFGMENKNEIKVNQTPINHPLNTILYGPPGTGKTHLTLLRASEIVENRKIETYSEAQQIFNTHLGDRIEFITFHQNYSYEDFIQGLRPDVETKGSLSFERKDGIFTQIAINALFEYYKIYSSNKKVVSQVQNSQIDINEIYLSFFDFLKSTPERVYKTKTGSDLIISSFTDRKCLNFSHSDSSIHHTVSGARLIKLYEIFPNLDLIKNVHKDITEALGGCNATVYWTALKEFIDFVNNKISIKPIQEEEGVYLNYEDISFDEKKKLLSTVNIYELFKIDKNSVPNYVIIIDEINRANISRVFGELITLIEPDKRSHGAIPLRCKLPSGDDFIVPSNLYILGAMNTADKSISLLDIALRRRFEFEAMYPLYEINGVEINSASVLRNINTSIKARKGADFQIGHAYFMVDNFDLISTMNKKVIPLLLEYFMNDEKEVKEILLKAGFTVDTENWPLKVS